jgi:hypothetical protein
LDPAATAAKIAASAFNIDCRCRVAGRDSGPLRRVMDRGRMRTKAASQKQQEMIAAATPL